MAPDPFDAFDAALEGDEEELVEALAFLDNETVHRLNHAAQRLLDATAVELDERYMVD